MVAKLYFFTNSGKIKEAKYQSAWGFPDEHGNFDPTLLWSNKEAAQEFAELYGNENDEPVELLVTLTRKVELS